MFTVIGMLIAGAICGVIARAVFPGEQKMGWIPTILLGIGGSFLAGYLGDMFGLYKAGENAGWIGSIVGALVLLFIWNRLSQKKPT
jgi:uncharacterized membrane protein YeaQ/YmgE (transglycosylase-associated protein family)